jgi:beta-glucosidase
LKLDYREYALLERRCAAEGCVLLENKNRTLPILPSETAALFGRVQTDTYTCGTGSGGMVHAPYRISILEGLKKQRKVYEPIARKYLAWTAANPPEKGNGWAGEPWMQAEMPLAAEDAEEAAEHADIGIAVIGRTAGEDKDYAACAGSYYLTDDEMKMLHTVRSAFRRMAVVLNTGSVIDMNWMDSVCPDAVLYLWQGGCETGNAAADVLSGAMNPCGKLTDTIAYSLTDYPSDKNFGGDTENIYEEGIYVGYRYFETFAKKQVRYPFGYGMSYSNFSWRLTKSECSSREINLDLCVENTGEIPGREVLQLYVCPPQGKLDKPFRNLIAFKKTPFLKQGETCVISFHILADSFASYDDMGKTGHPGCWVLEPGTYEFYAGFDVRSAEQTAFWKASCLQVFEKTEEAQDASERKQLAPAEGMAHGECLARKRRYIWQDVMHRAVSPEMFLNQLSNEELLLLTYGEGMCSPKGTPGTAAVFGGITKELSAYGIPICCCADGPSGIRMDSGAMAFSLPCGTSLACTFDPELVKSLYEMLGMEMIKNRVDVLLGPGTNIQRHPLCGRNFEYFSEDPFLSGTMASCIIKGLAVNGVSGTLKHFACNNQEHNRNEVNAVVSQRTLREIYLKPFEIAVKQGGAKCLMTSYNPVNGIWSASNKELLTDILREEWGFSGMVMTDWWAKMNEIGKDASPDDNAAMLRAQNDIYMVTTDASTDKTGNAAQALRDNTLTRAELLRSAKNICELIRCLPASSDVHPAEKLEVLHEPSCEAEDRDIRKVSIDTDSVSLDIDTDKIEKGTMVLFELDFQKSAQYDLLWKISCSQSEMAQVPFSFYWNSRHLETVSFHGKEEKTGEVHFPKNDAGKGKLGLYFSEGGLHIEKMEILRHAEETKSGSMSMS